MNIDQQIREILSRNYPVNDNAKDFHNNNLTKPQSLTGSVSIVGDHNIIVSSNLLMWEIFLLINICCFMYFLR